MRCGCARASGYRSSTSAPGLPTSVIDAALQAAQQRGLLHLDLQQVRPSERGFDFLSDLQALFLPPRRRAESPPGSSPG